MAIKQTFNPISGTFDKVNTPIETIALFCSPKAVNLTVDTFAGYFVSQKAYTINDIIANVNTAPTGSTIIIDITVNAVTIFSTKLTIDATEKTSTTAAVPYVLSTSSLAVGDEVIIKIDQVGSTIAGTDLLIQLLVTPV